MNLYTINYKSVILQRSYAFLLVLNFATLQVLVSLKPMEPIKIIECPRDAMQGIKTFIPTERKVTYIQSLLRVGFDTIDFGSFVSSLITERMPYGEFSIRSIHSTQKVNNNDNNMILSLYKK